MKVCAVTAALACAGGAAIVGHGPASGSDTPPPVSLDHYLCVGGLGGLCVPAKTTLPDGTTFEVSSPDARLVCSRQHDSWHRRDAHDAAPVGVSNELNPTPVSLVPGRSVSTCSVVTTHHSDRHFSHAHDATTPVATFSCSSVEPSSGSSPAPVSPLKIGDRLWVRVLDPTQLCVPVSSGAGPTVAASSPDSLLCYRVRAGLRPNHFFGPALTFCVPSTVGGSTTPGSTTTSAATTTTSSTTTTTTSPPSTTTSSTTTTSITSTTTSTTTTAGTTTTTTFTQPCAGIIINGVCIINV